MNSASPCEDGSFAEIRWFSMLERAAREASAEITTTLQLYASDLSPEIMGATTKLLYSDVLRMWLPRTPEVVEANTHGDANRPAPFFRVADDRMHNRDDEEFWQCLARVMAICGAETTFQGSPKFGFR